MSAGGFFKLWLGCARFVSTQYSVASVIPLRGQHRDHRASEGTEEGHRDADSADVGSYEQMCTAAGGCWNFRPSIMNQPRWHETTAIYSDSSADQEVHMEGKWSCSSRRHPALPLPSCLKAVHPEPLPHGYSSSWSPP